MTGFARRYADAVEVAAAIDASQTAQNADLNDAADPAKGAARVRLNVALAYPLGSIGDAALDSITPRNAPFNAKGDGATDDTAALIAALTSGHKIIDGGGRTYATTAQINVPAGVTLRNIVIQMADANYLAIGYNSDSALYGVRVIGTGRTNQYPDAQRGIGEQTGASSHVKIDAVVEACNVCFDHNGTTDSYIRATAKNASGLAGVSEGYGLLMYQGASRNVVHLICTDAARHALYVSSGSSQNHCVVHSARTKTQYSVQLNSTKANPVCSGNVISGTDVDSYGGVIMYMDVGGADAGGTLRNNVVRDFEVIANAGTNGNPAFMLSAANAGAVPASGNRFINCKAFGQFNNAGLGVIDITGGYDTAIEDCTIRAVCLNVGSGAFALQVPAGGITRIRGLDIDLLTSGAGIVGAYFYSEAGHFTFDDVQIICASATKTYFSGATASLRLGPGNVYETNVVVAAVAAGGAATAVIPVPQGLQGSSRVLLTVTSQSVANSPQTQAIVIANAGTTITVDVFNGHSAAQNITVDVVMFGLPG